MSRRPPSTYLTADELRRSSIAKPYRRHRVPNSNFWYLLTGIRIGGNESLSCIEGT